MLKSIYVNGLRSLSNFKLELRPGLNVLIGPNGAGKSNILTAMELVSQISQLDSIGHRIGGVKLAKLFDIYKKYKKIEICVEGETDTVLSTVHADGEKNEEQVNLSYKFAFTVVYQPQRAEKLQFSQQSLDLKLTFKNNRKSHKFKMEYSDGNSKILTCDDVFLRSMVKYRPKDTANAEQSELYGPILSRGEFLSYRSIVYELRLIFGPLNSVLKELKAGITYSIDPNMIRERFEEMQDPTIHQDGRGLQSVLLEICEKVHGAKHPQFEHLELYENYQDLYDTILVYLRDFLPKLCDLRVVFDSRREKIQGDLIYEDQVELPVDLLSDGSLKMLTLLTILLTKTGMTVLEEPENFLQPRMQHQIIELMREIVDDQNNVILFSTHSESIINSLEPNEVIFTKYEDGKTHAGRFANPEKLKNVIYESGLGLGWLYNTRVLDNRRLV